MVDPLSAWWAQQLVLCGWAFEPDPTVVDARLAGERLGYLGVESPNALGARLLEAFPPARPNPLRQLDALELLALATGAGWLPVTQAQAWVRRLAEEVTADHVDLESWLKALLAEHGAEGWVRGDDGFFEACEALASLEQDGDGVTWEMLEGCLAQRKSQATLWPSGPGDAVWRLRAVFAPTLSLPNQLSVDETQTSEWLAEVWQIDDRDGLVRLMLWMAGQGDRYGWDLDASRLVDLGAGQREAWLAELKEAEAYGHVLLAFLQRGEPLEWAAWDWLRLVELAYAGWCLGWLEQHEAEDFAVHALDLLSHRYSDWLAMMYAYQRGRSLFEARDVSGEVERDWSLLLLSSVSPWREPLGELLETPLRERSRTAMRAWRSDRRHWVLALASVREPDLLYRQGVALSVDAPRREDARSYLHETLGLLAEDGPQGVSRFWLPAQAHHLNQLAADASHSALPRARTVFGEPDAVGLAQRDGLANCSRHAATIYMAEKYAFYLQMAMDSEQFDAQGLAALAESLSSVLCRFYPDSRRLLTAWAAWESALPDGEGPALTHEIQWHRDDAGSPFHWLDWTPGAWQEPGDRPSLPRFTALALVGPLNASIWGSPRPESKRERQEIREWLDSHYGLHNSESVREFLDFLLSSGDRQEYQINYAPYTLNTARLASEIAVLESDDCSEEERNHLLRLIRVRNNVDGCNDIDMAAWDIAQAVDLAIAARQLDWLEESAFNVLLERAMQLAATHYSGWSAYARGLYAGFSFFMGETEERAAFLAGFREALVAWLTGAPPLVGAWASLDFPGARPGHWAALHIDTLSGDARTLH